MKTSMFAAGALVLALAAGSNAAAQATTGAGEQRAKPGTAKADDSAFAKEAAIGSLAEVELGKLATTNAGSDDVKKFGQRMVTDHGKASDELKQVAQKAQMTLPTELDSKHKATRDRLSKLNGAEFDKAYMSEMVKDHQQDVAAFRRESRTGQNADLKAWATKTLPTLEEHLNMAKETAAKVGASTTTAARKKSTAKKPSGQ